MVDPAGRNGAFIDRLRHDLGHEPDQRVVFDVPSHLNCGDSAIWRGDFLLYIRDMRSFDRAVGDLDCEVRLVPDAALPLGPLPRHPALTFSTLISVDHRVVHDDHGRNAALTAAWTHDAPSVTFEPDWAGALACIGRRGSDA